MTSSNPCTSHHGTQKRRWARETAARFVARIESRRLGVPLYVYHCPRCSQWHTTKHKQPEEPTT